jgi:hypothetical protein
VKRSPLKRGPVECVCEVCGTPFTVRFPSQSRKACSPPCANALTAAAKRGDANPMRRPEVAAAMSATKVARGLSRAPRTCARAGCQRPVRSGAAFYCSPRCHYEDPARVGHRQQQAYHRCFACGIVFAWNGRGKGVYCSASCGGTSGPVAREPDVVMVVQVRGHRRAEFHDPTVVCRRCGRGGPLQHHHVVYRQHVEREHGDRWHPDNALALCRDPCHYDAHRHLVTLGDLRDENYAFAGALLGPAAYDYLRRRYAGMDPRLDALLALPPRPRGTAAGRPPAHEGRA